MDIDECSETNLPRMQQRNSRMEWSLIRKNAKPLSYHLAYLLSIILRVTGATLLVDVILNHKRCSFPEMPKREEKPSQANLHHGRHIAQN
jgi:hypothetical protein